MFWTRFGLAVSLGLLTSTSAWAVPTLLSQSQLSTWRSQGATGLEEFLKAKSADFPASLQQLPSEVMRRQLDGLCQQRDCHASKLYWHTDLNQAKAAAQAENKPILSLRLLGNLNEELSCANSRLFRLALYPNAEVSKYLRDNYILHWESVRPVPQVTIDYGDGRQLKRTLTGNSIHYILDAQGQPLDALPGFYGPQAFLQELRVSRSMWSRVRNALPERQAQIIASFHIGRLQRVQNQWVQDLAKTGLPPMSIPDLPTTGVADDAGRLAISKMVVEAPLVSAALGFSSTVDRNLHDLQRSTDNATWLKIANLHRSQAQLDQPSRDLIFSKNSKYQSTSDPSFRSTIANLETSMALDTVRNEYLLRTRLRQWFATGEKTKNLAQLNEQVYAQLFLTPNSDPWLGLVSDSAYSAIEGDGIQK